MQASETEGFATCVFCTFAKVASELTEELNKGEFSRVDLPTSEVISRSESDCSSTCRRMSVAHDRDVGTRAVPSFATSHPFGGDSLLH